MAIYVLVWGAFGIFSIAAVWALQWAVRGDQFQDPVSGARSIFDPDEPMGVVTDTFPKGGSARDQR